MKSSKTEIAAIIGTLMGGGYYAGRIMVGGQAYALVVAPKAEGEHPDTQYHDNYDNIEGAKHYDDGIANTNAMAEAGSALAKWAKDLRIGDNDDWYLPSQDELEIIYRNLKPTTRENSCYARSGINLSAVEPTRPYTPKFPLQTQAELFQEGGAEAFEADWYWSSTQHASHGGYAWCQTFTSGYQNYTTKDDIYCRARAVRRLPI
jgi:hypothetical protein